MEGSLFRRALAGSALLLVCLSAFALPAGAVRLGSVASTLKLATPTVTCTSGTAVRLSWTDTLAASMQNYYVMSLPFNGKSSDWTRGPALGKVTSATFATTPGTKWNLAIEATTSKKIASANRVPAKRDSNVEAVTVTCPVGDTTPPSVPVISNATTPSCSQVNLSWSASTDTGGSALKGYNVFRDGTFVAFTTATSISDSGLAPSSAYSYQLRALDNANNASALSTARNITTPACPDGTPPSLPGNVSVSAASCSQVNVSWSGSTDTGGSGLKGYNVFRNGAFWTFTAATSIADTGRTGSTVYAYQVQSLDNAGNTSAITNGVATTTPACPDTSAPSVPGGPTATAASCSQVNVSWGASTDTGGSGLKGYNVFRNGSLLTFTTATSLADTGRSPSTAYAYQVQALDNANNASALSAAANANTPACPDTTAPSVPGGPSASASSCSQVNVSWSASTDTGGSGLKGYNVYRNGSFWTFTSATSIADTGRPASTAHSYQIQAVDNANNSSGLSAFADATTPACPDTIAPSVPGSVSASAASCTQVNVSWGASTDTGGSGLKGYNVYRNGSLLTFTTNLALVDSGRAASTAYSYQVQAVDNANNSSALSSASGATTPACPDTIAPSVPGSVSASASSCSQVNVSWAASTDTGGSNLKGYNVYRGGSLLTFTTNTSFSDTGRSASTAYSYQVQAVDNASNSSALSSAAGATTPACPNQPPVPNAGSDQSGVTGATLTFNGNGSSDPDGSITAYAWTFGDGSGASGVSVSHAYASAGTYTVTLTVTDNAGAQRSDTAAVTITNPTTSGPWAQTFGGSDSDSGNGVATDASGNIYVAGTFRGTARFGSTTLTAAGDSDMYIAKYTPAGAVVWAKRYGAAQTETVNGVAVDGSGNVTVVGSFSGSTNLGGGGITPNGSVDMFVAQYDNAGNYKWAKNFGGGGTNADSARDVALDSAGNIYITGSFSGTANFGGGNMTVPFTSDYDVFIAKFTSAGAHVWSKNFPNDGNEQGYGIAVQGERLAIGGSIFNSVNFSGQPLGADWTLTSAGALTDGFVAVFTTNGAYLWSRQVGSSTGSEAVDDVALDAAGNAVIVTSPSKDVDAGGGVLPTQSGTDVVVAKYAAANGSHLWSRRWGGGANDYGRGVDIDSAGNLILVGYLASPSMVMGSTTLSSLNSSPAGYVAKIGGASGDVIWAKQYSGNQFGTANIQAVSVTGTVPVVAGYFNGTATYEGTSYTSAGMADGIVMRLAP